MTHLAVSLLGPFQMELDGKPVTGFESAKVRALLAFLAAEAGRPHMREALAEMLWPEHPAAAASANLRHVLMNLRKVIGDAAAEPPFLLITQETLQFNLASNVGVDLACFLGLLRATVPPPLSACEAALALRRGPFMDGFVLDGSPQFEEWVVVMREQVDHRAGQALARLVDDCVRCDRFAQAAEWTRQQLVLEPWNEEGHQQLIWLLAMNGQRAAALQHYEVCRRMLANELDVEPQPATEALVARIRAGVTDIGPWRNYTGKQRAAPVNATTAASAVHLPPRSAAFFGRASELATIAARVADPACRLLTVLGPGGIGKTFLAVEAAYAQTGAFADGVFFVSLAPVSTSDSLAGVLVQALDVVHQEAGDTRRQLLAWLSRRQILLVLDNFEHLIGSVDLLVDLLAAAPGVKLLVTSRVRLNLHDEWLAPLDGLELPPDVDGVCAGDLADYSATRLFLHAANRVRPGFNPDAAGAATIARICRMLEGIPLGIELAAAWTRALALPDIALELERGLSLLATTVHDMPARHRSMVTVFDQSWQMLSADERAVLRQLAVFRGGCTRDAAVTVAGATLAGLSSLVDQSWLRLRADGRYELHELIRQYCVERLENEHAVASQEPADAVRQRHCAYFAAYLHTVLQTMNYQQAAGPAVMAELGNVQDSLVWAARTEDVAAFLDMLIGMIFVAELSGGYRFAIRALDATLTAVAPPAAIHHTDQQPNGTPALLRSMIRWRQGPLYLSLGLLEQAEACCAQSLFDLQQIAASEHQRFLLAVVRLESIRPVFTRGEYEEVRRLCREMLTVFQAPDFTCMFYGKERGQKFWQAQVYATLGEVAWALGDNGEAQEMLGTALALRAEIGEQRYRAFNLALLASVLRTAGEHARGAAMAQEAVRLSLAFGDAIGVAFARLALGRIEVEQGDLVLAQEHLGQSMEVGRKTGFHTLWMDSLCALGQVELALGHVAVAKNYYGDVMAAAAALDTPNPAFCAKAWLGLGCVALAERDFTLARAFLNQALRAKGVPVWVRKEIELALAQVAEAEREREHESPV